ncbi:hypothetical protein K443DRAFT_573883 [Laccaria amethystina LaAM-08-1]|uniref:Unplaced genomic scaffold K443scaffold_74, whole genome shotgun sequence n=1 Tax=Laccaria amethystina LaAM-08-1 TaxID=1095629 RepID=A0A0C9XIA8_9AGAR|nr:hypothetical protein K443DRAFT_573883 [Laccaria amethystina LaAM-08-1]
MERCDTFECQEDSKLARTFSESSSTTKSGVFDTWKLYMFIQFVSKNEESVTRRVCSYLRSFQTVQ